MNSSSKCYEFLVPLIEQGVINAYESFVLGHGIAKNGTDFFETGLTIIGEIQVFKEKCSVSQENLKVLYELLIENNIKTVFNYMIY